MKIVLLATMVLLTIVYAEELDAVQQYSTSYNQFTSEIYTEMLKSQSGNFLVCPLSLDIILGLVTNGAKGNTHKELVSTLRLPENSESIREIYSTFHKHLKSGELYKLITANKVYIKNGVTINPEFKKVAVDTFGAEIQNIDFAENVEAATKINQWVEEKTLNNIKDLVEPGSFDEHVKAVLVNAMYFQAEWAEAFKEFNTKKRLFKATEKHHVEIDMMKQNEMLGYFECTDLNAKFLELPYLGSDISMHIVLPNDEDGLAKLETKMPEVLTPPEYKYEFVEVILPKFKMETKIKFKPILKAMGIKEAFEPSANFQGLVENVDELRISEVVQKTFIDVDEKGTTAAAATALIMKDAALIVPESYKLFYADHPFLFYLRLNKLGINFFVGRYVSP